MHEIDSNELLTVTDSNFRKAISWSIAKRFGLYLHLNWDFHVDSHMTFDVIQCFDELFIFPFPFDAWVFDRCLLPLFHGRILYFMDPSDSNDNSWIPLPKFQINCRILSANRSDFKTYLMWPNVVEKPNLPMSDQFDSNWCLFDRLRFSISWNTIRITLFVVSLQTKNLHFYEWFLRLVRKLTTTENPISSTKFSKTQSELIQVLLVVVVLYFMHLLDFYPLTAVVLFHTTS